MAKIPGDWEAQSELYTRAVGETIRAWAEFEMVLCILLCHLLATDEFRGRVVWFSLSNFRARRTLIERLGETYIDDSEIQRFRSLMRRTKKLGANRNTLAHGWGDVDQKKKKIVLISDKEDVEFGMDFVGTAEIDLSAAANWSKDILALQGDIISFYQKHLLNKIHVLSRMHREQNTRRTKKDGYEQRQSAPATPKTSPEPSQE